MILKLLVWLIKYFYPDLPLIVLYFMDQEGEYNDIIYEDSGYIIGSLKIKLSDDKIFVDGKEKRTISINRGYFPDLKLKRRGNRLDKILLLRERIRDLS